MPVLFSVRRTRSHCRTVIFKGLGNLPTSKKCLCIYKGTACKTYQEFPIAEKFGLAIALEDFYNSSIVSVLLCDC